MHSTSRVIAVNPRRCDGLHADYQRLCDAEKNGACNAPFASCAGIVYHSWFDELGYVGSDKVDQWERIRPIFLEHWRNGDAEGMYNLMKEQARKRGRQHANGCDEA